MVEVKDAGITLAKYRYDGLHRRAVKETYSGNLAETRHFYYSGLWQVLEERIGTSTGAERQYLWGVRYVDELVLRDRSGERLYALQNANWNVTALAGANGNVVERYDYGAYGQPQALDSNFTLRASATYDWEVLFAGYVWDRETGLYQVRNRTYHPTLGRWIQKDPLGYDDGMNLYEYVESNPTGYIDPTGLIRRRIVPLPPGSIPIPCPPMVHTVCNTQCVRDGYGRGSDPTRTRCYRTVTGNVANCDCKCNACNPGPDVGAVGHQVHNQPGDCHHPCPGGHIHIFDRHQNPNNCRCFWTKRKIPICLDDGEDPAGKIPPGSHDVPRDR
jgi:RHS repeat-associated protein